MPTQIFTATTAVLSVALVAFLFPLSVLAQQSEPAANRPVATAVQAAETPVLDGILDERVWQDAAPLTDFVQSDPFEGQPSSQRTEVRILYDATAM